MNNAITQSEQNIKIKTKNLNLYYGTTHALKDINIDILDCAITAIIGPSGCGKSSLLRIFNRMNDLIPIARVDGSVLLDGADAYGGEMDAVSLRQKVGMVFQKPNPFPCSIYDNIAYGPRHLGRRKSKGDLDEIVERSLLQVSLWHQVKDNLKKPAFELSLGEQQCLCIARTLAVEPEVILFDESCSALDPESTMKVEELMQEMAEKYCILIVTHNMEQARRIADMSAFIMIDENKSGTLVEYAPTLQMFSYPKDKRTEDYITGRFG